MRKQGQAAMKPRWTAVLEGASRVIDLSSAAFTQRRSRSVAELHLKADLITARAFPDRNLPEESPPSIRLFVGALPWDLTDDALAEAFAPFGEVIKAAIVRDRETHRSRGFAFVEMVNITNETINLMDDLELLGRRITVNEARPREDRPRRARSFPPATESRPTPGLSDANEGSPEQRGNDLSKALPGHDTERSEVSLIQIEIIVPGTELAEEADRVLSGVGA
jgi:hypothetical protein